MNFKITFLALCFITSLYSQGIRLDGAFRNSIHSFESDRAHTHVHQSLRFKIALPNDNLSISANLRTLTDVNHALPTDERFKLYTLRADGRMLDNRLNLAFGRLFLHPGAPLGALDGLHLQAGLSKQISLQLYGGVESRFDRSFQLYNEQRRDVYGGLAQFSNFFASKIQLFLLNKSGATATAWRLGGVNVDCGALPKTLLRAQTHYDLERSRLHRLMLAARKTWSDRWQTSLEYRRQQPQVFADSYFTIFTPIAFQRWRAAAAFEFIPDYTIELQAQHILFEKETADQLYMTIGNDFGEVGVVWESGYAGDQLGVTLNAYYEVLTNLIASLYVDFSKYRTEQIYEYDRQLANAVRLSYRLNRRWSADIEYQWLTDRWKSSDARVLNHITFIW